MVAAEAPRELITYVNGKRFVMPPGRAETTLLTYLRELGFTGTKLGCGEGGCGACTVMVSCVDPAADPALGARRPLIHRAVNACLCPIYAVEGCAVVTVEGLGSPKDGLHPVQARLARAHGSQCGFCTPGFVMSMYSLLRSSPKRPTEHEIEEALAGNLCRCTGYRPILDAFREFAKVPDGAYTEEALEALRLDEHAGAGGAGGADAPLAKKPARGGSATGHSKGKSICPSSGLPCECGSVSADGEVKTTSDDKGPRAYGDAVPSYAGRGSEPIFPPELRARAPCDLHVPGPVAGWRRPASLASLLAIKARDPTVKLVAGNSEVGIEMKFKRMAYRELVTTQGVPELAKLAVVDLAACIANPGLVPEVLRGSPADLAVPAPSPTTTPAIEAAQVDRGLPAAVAASGLVDASVPAVAFPGSGPTGREAHFLGAGASLTSISKFLREWAGANAGLPPSARSAADAVAEQLCWFAGPPIRNVATLGGNIATGSPISDLNPVWVAAGALFLLAKQRDGDEGGAAPSPGDGAPSPSPPSFRYVPATEFFIGYRKTALAPKEVLVGVLLPVPQPGEFVREFKQAHRRDDDIAIVNAGTRLRVMRGEGGGEDGPEAGPLIIASVHLAFGGVAAVVVQAKNAEAALSGKPLTQETVKEALGALRQDVNVAPLAPGGMGEYRNALAASFLFKSVLAAEQAFLREERWVQGDGGVGGASDSGAALSSGSGSGSPTAAEAGRRDGADALAALPEAGVSPTSSSAGDAPPEVAASPTSVFGARAVGAADRFSRPPARGLQYYSASQPGEDVVGVPYQHRSADVQASGFARYADDENLPAHCLHAALVLSPKPHAKVVSIDAGPAQAVPGFHAAYFADDIPGSNEIGPIFHDEKLFYNDEVVNVGSCVGVVVAETEAAARSAARAVKVEYEALPDVLDIHTGIERKTVVNRKFDVINAGEGAVGGDASPPEDSVAAAVDAAAVVVSGSSLIGGQEHFYLEPNACVVVPHEDGEVHTWASTQCVDKHQQYIAGVLGLPMSKVVVRTKRVGGGFGGKESRAAMINAAAAVAAWNSRRPVRLVLDRDEDMLITGQRHAFASEYRVGLAQDGSLAGLHMTLWANMGYSFDLSPGVIERAVSHADNVYRFQRFAALGRLVATNQASNTAYRGFGGPQGMLATELALEHLAKVSGVPLREIRERNMYEDGDRAPFGQALPASRARACWDEVHRRAEWDARLATVEAYNRGSRYRKRGLAALPVKFGIAFTAKHLNQAGALVHAYTDGTVLVSHGGVEMGQGLHTKVAQVVAAGLRIPLSQVHIAETSTDKVPNASPTAASAGSDLYGAAAADACEQLVERLAPYYPPFAERLVAKRRAEGDPAALALDASADPLAQAAALLPLTPDERTVRPTRTRPAGPGFAAAIAAAYLDRVDLCAHGFYATPHVQGFGSKAPFGYFTYGAAVSEVEIDCLTGDMSVVRADVVMDVGASLNPAIDVGQVEGAFVQGMGWSCLEELVWGDDAHPWVPRGWLHTRGPGTYKIPSVNDVPVDFRVSLLHNAPCAETPKVHSSKAVGEPPFFLGASVFFAIKEAIYAARADAGELGWFRLDPPATPEKIRMACLDDIAGDIIQKGFQAKMSC